MRQTVQVGWGMDFGDRSPTSLLMYGGRNSECHESQCCETTLIIYAEMALVLRRSKELRRAFVPALSLGPPDDYTHQSPLVLGLCLFQQGAQMGINRPESHTTLRCRLLSP